jgi:CIC family chloride channel protein
MKVTKKWQIRVQRKLNKINIDEDTIFFSLTLFIGVFSGIVAVALKMAIYSLTDYVGTTRSPNLESVASGLAFVLISAFITFKIAPATSGSGIPDLRIALVVNRGKILLKDWVAKFVTSVFSLSSGIVLGREGPTLAITAGLGSTIGNLFSLSQARIKTLVAVGAAGGISAAFNTPIAAVVFTLEEIVGNMNTKSLGPIIISAVAASVTAKVFYGGESMFHIDKYDFDNPAQLPYFILVGIICALVGPLWVKFLLNYRSIVEKFFKNHKILLIVAIYALLVGIAYVTPMVLGGGDNVINQALQSQLTDWKLVLFLLVIKFIFSALWYASGISGGVFMPTLFMGAMTGTLVGIVANFFSPDALAIGAFTLVGMGAYFAAVIRAPFTSILIIFELTQDYKVMLPLMLANITAYILSQKISNGSIYEQISEQDGIHLPTKEDNEILEQITVEDAMIKDVKTLNSNLTVKDALSIVNHSEITGFPVMRNGLVFGVISSNEIGQAFAKFEGDTNISEVCNKKLYSVYPDQSLTIAFHYLKKYRVGRLLVVSRVNDRKLVGIITAEDVVNRFGFHIQEESKYNLIDQYIDEYNQKQKARKEP